MEKNEELRNAWDFVEHTGISIFLTGKAGTGKTTFLKAVKEHSTKRIVVVAPTGVAAINAGGVTIHSFFQLPLSPFIPESRVKSKFDYGKEKRKIFRTLDLLIIDEISMVRADILDAIDSVLRRFREHNKPFGGVQLLMIGDLQQLTPVVTADEEELLKKYYETPYFFGSRALQRIQYVTIELTKVFRQQDQKFIDILNHFREGKVTNEDFKLLNSRYLPDFKEDENSNYIKLTTHNRIADNYNNQKLAQIKNKAYTFTAETQGIFPETNYPADYKLTLKVGAQVMFIHNDSRGRYYNGKIGRITYIDENQILVLCPNETEAIEVEQNVWENTKYTLNEKTKQIEDEVVGAFRQYPLRLAWAITIHKSQGLTFEYAIIDAQLAFASGQTYVALSRCRTLEGLVLATTLNQNAVINDQRVNQYIEQQNVNARQSIENLPALKEEYFRFLLLEMFNFADIFNNVSATFRTLVEYFHKYQKTIALHRTTMDDMKKQIIAVSEKWETLVKNMPASALHDEKFLERVKNGARYFHSNLTELVSMQLEKAKEVEGNNQMGMQKLQENIAETKQTYIAKRLLLEDMMDETFTTQAYLRSKQEATLIAIGDGNIETKRKKRKKEKPIKEEKIPTHVVSYTLFRSGKSVEQIAQERKLAISTINGHLSKYVKSGDLSITELVDEKKIDRIKRIAKGVGSESGLKAIKDLCPSDYTYEEIKLVLIDINKAKQ